MSDWNTGAMPVRSRIGRGCFWAACDSRGEVSHQVLWPAEPRILTPCPFETKFARSSSGAEKEPN